MLDGHILYMSNWIVLYESCTKINVTHLSIPFVDTETKNSVQSSKQLGLQTVHTMEGKHTLEHTPTHTQRDHGVTPWKTNRTDPSTQVCVCVCVCYTSVCADDILPVEFSVRRV